MIYRSLPAVAESLPGVICFRGLCALTLAFIASSTTPFRCYKKLKIKRFLWRRFDIEHNSNGHYVIYVWVIGAISIPGQDQVFALPGRQQEILVIAAGDILDLHTTGDCRAARKIQRGNKVVFQLSGAAGRDGNYKINIGGNSAGIGDLPGISASLVGREAGIFPGGGIATAANINCPDARGKTVISAFFRIRKI
jgi:hypothetical protein